MEGKAFIINNKKRRILQVTLGIVFVTVGIVYLIGYYRGMNCFYWIYVVIMLANGITHIFLGLKSTLLYVKRTGDHLTIKWDNKFRRQIIPINVIDRVVLNEWNFEIKLSDGLSRKFSFINVKYKDMKNLNDFLKKSFSNKIK